ncbi:MAG TPA: class I SAM-dependent methyltransferase, partial [Bacillota bacterium]|nr:class I SAM-dependent methyltransferase [Bacillota bacterium]
MSKNHWDKSFSKSEYIYGKEPNVFLEEMSELFPPSSKIACLAEGEGRNAVFLAQRGHEVTAYEQSKVGIEKMNQLAAEKEVYVQSKQIDLTTERLDEGAYDVATLVFGHVPEEKQDFLLDNLFQSVKKDGYVLFELYSEEQIEYGTGGPGRVEAL